MPTGFWRPFHREGVAYNCHQVAVTLECPRMNGLPTRLLHGRQGGERTRWLEAGLFLELPPGGRQQVFIGFGFPLGYRPRTLVLLAKEWTARVDEQHLGGSTTNPIHQQSGADPGHSCQPC